MRDRWSRLAESAKTKTERRHEETDRAKIKRKQEIAFDTV
jgi:hypothetical protein